MSYSLSRLVRKYSKPFKIEIKSPVSYDEYGEPISQSIELREETGAIMAISTNRIYLSGGAISSEDRKLYMITPLPNPLNGTEIIYQGLRYHVEADRDYHDFDNIYSYLLKRVKNDDKSEGDSEDDSNGVVPDTEMPDYQEQYNYKKT